MSMTMKIRQIVGNSNLQNFYHIFHSALVKVTELNYFSVISSIRRHNTSKEKNQIFLINSTSAYVTREKKKTHGYSYNTCSELYKQDHTCILVR